jgi:hypothetical protein
MTVLGADVAGLCWAICEHVFATDPWAKCEPVCEARGLRSP